MLHLRLTVPVDRTDAVLELLHDDVGVTNIMVVRAAMTKPDGDLVQADVVREHTCAILQRRRFRHRQPFAFVPQQPQHEDARTQRGREQQQPEGFRPQEAHVPLPP